MERDFLVYVLLAMYFLFAGVLGFLELLKFDAVFFTVTCLIVGLLFGYKAVDMY